MIDRQALLRDLQSLLKDLRDDIRERVEAQPDLDARLREEHRAAREAPRTAEPYEEWREEPITQAAVAWILGCVFVRFLEDNGLVDTPRLSGPGERLALARDHHTLFFQKHPSETDREYLLDVFGEVGQLPAAKELFDKAHNPLWSLPLSGDGARKLLDLWQRIDPATGALVHDFTDPEWGTRFLGDLYQDLSEDARKRYALLQTPEFVEEFILDRTLSPAIDTFGYRQVRLIDPTCGSGHFLLGAFRRFFDLHLKHEPGTNVRELVQGALNGVWGVDINPFAVAITRFRLLVAALKASSVSRLKDTPGYAIHLAVGDSLLHGPRFVGGQANLIPTSQMTLEPSADPLRHVYATEDREALRAVLGQRYHAVVGNPPYITVKDQALNEAYRLRYDSCHMKYSLAVPFMERCFELAFPGPDSAGGSQASVMSAGYVGMITSNSFMKREFGKKLIESFIPRWDLTQVLDTSGAYIPGHGTPTVMLFGRDRLPVGDTVRAVMGIRGEPTTPEDASQGLVWRAIVSQVDQPGSSSEWVSVSDTVRATFHKHPWSIGGGGAAELKELLSDKGEIALGQAALSVGVGVVTGEDDVFSAAEGVLRRCGLEREELVPLVTGEVIRDWVVGECDVAVFPYLRPTLQASLSPTAERYLWPYRCNLGARTMFRQTQSERGLDWYEWSLFAKDRFRSPLSIAFPFVATHNHFVLDRGGKVFKQTAPVVKLPEDATEDDHLVLLGVLNSSAACFWMKQVCFDKGTTSDSGVLQADPESFRFEFDSTKLRSYPLPALSPEARGALVAVARVLQTEGDQLSRPILGQALEQVGQDRASLAEAVSRVVHSRSLIRKRMVRLQEELDWLSYEIYGLLSSGSPARSRLWVEPVDTLDGLDPDARPYRAHARGESAGLSGVDAVRLELLRCDTTLPLIERPEYKRRWYRPAGPYSDTNLTDNLILERELRCWLCDRLESPAYWPQPETQSCARVADRAHADAEFVRVAELLRGRADFDVTALVTELVETEAAPFLPVLRYKETGLRKRALWERTWELQRREDAGEKIGTIEVPPKYTSADFLKGHYWRLRGKLDVPKERFISYPGCERSADPTLVVGWAGWDHLEQAQALAGHYVAMKDAEGWPRERLVPLLAGLLELLPWLEQWHNAPNPAYGMGLGEYFRRFVDEEARSLDLTIDAIRAWKPEKGSKKGKKRVSKAD